MDTARATALPFPGTTAWIIAGILAVTGPAVQWLAPPESGFHPYFWASLLLTPTLALAAVLGRQRPLVGHAVVATGSLLTILWTAVVSPEPVPGGLLRPVAALPLWVAATILPFPLAIIGMGVVSLAATGIAGRHTGPATLGASLVSQAAAAAIAWGISYGWRQGRLAAMEVGRLATEVETRRAEQAVLQRFVHRAAHELRTPLASISLVPDILEKETDPVRRQRQITLFRDRLRHLKAILDRMATLSTVGMAEPGGRSDLVLEARRATSDPRTTLDLPEEAWVGLYSEAVDLALKELVQNAMAVAKDHIRLRIEDGGGFWILHVEDDGPGIPESDREAVLEPFGRVEMDLPPQAGTGLGLAIAQTIALNAGGSLSLGHSEWGGTRASLRLPKA